MRIMLVAHGFPPEEQSGTELYTAELAQALARQGHAVMVFAGSHAAHEPLQVWRSDGDVEIERIARPRARVRLGWSEDSIERAFLSALNRFGPDVVHVQHLLGLTMPLVSRAKEWGIPVVLTLHDHWFLCPEVQPFRPGLHRLGVHLLGGDRRGLACFVHLELLHPRRCAAMVAHNDVGARVRGHLERARVAQAELAAADLLIAPSRFLRERFVEFGVPPEQVLVLPHGVPDLGEQPAAPDRTEVHVGYLGPLIRDKGADLLVAAFLGVRNPSVRLVVRGAEPDARFARQVRRLAARDPRISVGPALPRTQVGGFLAGLDLLVVPSRFPESFSLVAHEAFACRVPVVASDGGALPELVTPGANGALFRTGSRRDLRARLSELLDDPAALRALESFPQVKPMDAHAGELAALYAGEPPPQPFARYARASARSVES